MRSRRASRGGAWIVIGILVLLWFGTLGLRPLYKADESRYGEIPREMVQTGDWVTPRLNDLKYFEKPPLQYWATAVFYRALGVGEFSARLWAALLGFLGLLMTYFAGRRLFGTQAGRFAAALLLASPVYVGCSQFITLDMGLTFFLSAAVFAFAIAQTTKDRAWMLVFWVACALAVLSKGLVGIVLPGGAIGLYLLVRRDWDLLRRLDLLRGVGLFIVIAAPWFVAVSLANPEFAHFFFIQEHLQRFTTKMHHRYHPPWYFIPVLAVAAAPWLIALFAGWSRALLMRQKAGFDARLFLAIWSATVFVFFSLSSSKLPAYILPIVPALALLAGDWLSGADSRRVFRVQCWPVVLAAVALAVFTLAGGEAFTRYSSEFLDPYVPWLLASAVLLAASSFGAFWMARRGSLSRPISLLALGVFAATQLALVGHKTLAENYSVASLVAALPAPPAADAAIFAVNGYDHTMPWTLRRPVTMVGYSDELGEAVRWEPHKFIPDLAGFSAAWGKAKEAYAFVPVREFDRFVAETGLSADIVARGPRYVLVKKK